MKQLPLAGNSNGGRIFGWGSSEWKKSGFYLELSYGVIVFRQGLTSMRYEHADSVKLGYNESIPEKRYLTYRPLTDERWHQLIISMRKIKRRRKKRI